MTASQWIRLFLTQNEDVSISVEGIDIAKQAMISQYWVDIDLDLIKYTDMDNRYLRNSYLLARRTSSRINHIPYLAQELINRGFDKTEPELFI